MEDSKTRPKTPPKTILFLASRAMPKSAMKKKKKRVRPCGPGRPKPPLHHPQGPSRGVPPYATVLKKKAPRVPSCPPECPHDPPVPSNEVLPSFISAVNPPGGAHVDFASAPELLELSFDSCRHCRPLVVFFFLQPVPQVQLVLQSFDHVSVLFLPPLLDPRHPRLLPPDPLHRRTKGLLLRQFFERLGLLLLFVHDAGFFSCGWWWWWCVCVCYGTILSA